MQETHVAESSPAGETETNEAEPAGVRDDAHFDEPSESRTDQPRAKAPGTGWFRLALVCSALGVVVPLLFGPAAALFGLLARDRRHPRALLPIALGVALTLFGIIYYVRAAG